MKRSRLEAFKTNHRLESLSKDFHVQHELQKRAVTVTVERITIIEDEGCAGYLYRSSVLPGVFGLDPKHFSGNDEDIDKCATLDFILRAWISSEKKRKEGVVYEYLLGGGRGLEPKQCIVDRSSIFYDGSHIVLVCFFPSRQQSAESAGSFEPPFDLSRFVNCVPPPDEILFMGAHGKDVADLREFVGNQSALAFIANGSILPRISGEEDLPARSSNVFLEDNELGDNVDAQGRQVVAFKAPASLETTFKLPRTGTTLTGMLVKDGINVISGGGFQGKTTLLKALSGGHLDRVMGDGREYCVCASRAPMVCLRAEDGRRVSAVDISAFISDLPVASGLDAANFSTLCASGSTSQASGVVEALELGACAFLIDEDTSAVNFMIRDGRMRSLIDRETITPLIYRVSNLHKQKGVSTVVVVGGSGDWFDVQSTTLLMDNYECIDATARARRISKAFCSGHIQYNGQGVVHQLPWPGPGTEAPVTALREREEHTGVKERFLDMLSLLQKVDGAFHAGGKRRSFDFSVDDEGRSVRFKHAVDPASQMPSVPSTPPSADTAVLNLTRVEELTATGETRAAAVGVGVAVVLLLCSVCGEGGDAAPSGQEDALLPSREGLESTLQVVAFGRQDEEQKSDGQKSAAVLTKGYQWQRLNHLLDHYEKELYGNMNLLIEMGRDNRVEYSSQVWRMVGEGFIWPSRILLGKALNRFPGAEFCISRTAESIAVE